MRIEKVSIMDEVVSRVKDSDYCFVVNYGGVSVSAISKFRADLRAHDSRMLVVKNSFLAKVAKEKGWPETIEGMFVGPTAIVTGKGEVTDVAKDVMEFVKANADKASVKGADYDSQMLDASKVEALSKIPGKDQLRSMFLATLKEPAASLARVLKAKADKEGGDEAPAAEAPAAEAPAEA